MSTTVYTKKKCIYEIMFRLLRWWQSSIYSLKYKRDKRILCIAILDIWLLDLYFFLFPTSIFRWILDHVLRFRRCLNRHYRNIDSCIHLFLMYTVLMILEICVDVLVIKVSVPSIRITFAYANYGASAIFSCSPSWTWHAVIWVMESSCMSVSAPYSVLSKSKPLAASPRT